MAAPAIWVNRGQTPAHIDAILQTHTGIKIISEISQLFNEYRFLGHPQGIFGKDKPAAHICYQCNHNTNVI